MAKFCTNCGKKLKDGEVCDCKKVEISTKDFNSYMTSLLNVLKGMFVKPIDALKSFIADSNFVLALIILLIAALSTSAMTLVLIKQLYGQIGLLGGGMMGLALSSVEIPYVKIFFITLFVSIVVYFILAGMLYLVGSSILKGETTFKKIITLLASSSVVNIVGIILTTLIMLVSFKIAIVIFMISSLLYMFYLYQGMKFTFKIDENKLAYILTSALVITDIIVIFVLPKLMN